ncbi:hypothetical protein OHA77_27285 [Streptosporangium sp. NBC_01639]|uniref:hypothetical protein n=1 Tax=Streptosporangium sp. NBC_01639 TaxID=2975948 RepID=UPI003867287A|nr:hypothetical protein OHA77_27285 [Streptosporangium sp. NBC_01639]
MPQPLLGQRTRGELIAELYDRHAAGLFAYCHDQLGDPGSACAALAAVLDSVTEVEPPRAALYAAARREIYLRDVVYAPPAAGTDPVAAFVERVLRDLRPHQREVLYLSGVCEMGTAELSWVLDVAADTADELTVSACRRFAQSLNLALASVQVPDQLADVFGALPVAPVRDVLVRAPWAVPPAALRAAALRSQPGTAPAPSSPALRVKPLWPTAPAWPPPLPEAADDRPAPSEDFPDPFSFRGVPAAFAAPNPGEVSAHEATTEPMPKLRDTVLTALDDVVSRPRRPRLQRPRPRGAAPLPAAPSASPLSAPLPADVLDDLPSEKAFRPLTPEARAALIHTDRLVAAAPREEAAPAAFRDDPAEAPEHLAGSAPAPAHDGTATAQPPLPGWPLRLDELDVRADVGPALAADRPGAGREPHPERPATGRMPSPEWPDIERTPSLEWPATERMSSPGWSEAEGMPSPERPKAEGMPSPEWPDIERTPSLEWPETERTPSPEWPEAGGMPSPGWPDVEWAPYAKQPRKDTRRPKHAARTDAPRRPESEAEPETDTPDGTGEAADAGTAQVSRPRRADRRARREQRQAGRGERHHDWVWELVGFLVCVAIAMIVFFLMPTR